MTITDAFTEHRGLLFAIAYRMLGSVADAEDAVQETYLRWANEDRSNVASPRAYLTTIVTRICLDQLKSARARREVYIGSWLPEPLVGATPESTQVELAESLSMAFLVLLEKLSPPERAAFLLREVFGFDYAEIAEVLGKTEPACRQTVKRARDHLGQPTARFTAPSNATEELRDRFAEATLRGDVEALLELLAEDAAIYTDHGGKATAARRTILGASKVARFFVGVTSKFLEHDTITELRIVNGRPGLISFLHGRAITAITFEAQDNRIQAIYIVRNPDKLQHIRPT